MPTEISNNPPSFQPTAQEEWNRDMNILGITMSLLIVKNLASVFAAHYPLLSSSKDGAQFCFLVVSFIAGAAAVYARNMQHRNQVYFMFKSPFLFCMGMALIVVNALMIW